MSEPAVNPFKYGGKELDTHMPQPFYDFVARMQLPQLCLFQRPDPKASDYTWLNPFTYCAGDPINYVDMDGRLIIFVNGMHFGDGGSSEYWNGVDNSIMNELNDSKALYYDGSNGGFYGLTQNLKYKNRVEDGYNAGKTNAKGISEMLEDGETIKFVTHSMGAAYAKGFISGIREYDETIIDRIDFELDIAPFQAKEQVVQKGVDTFTLQHSSDMIAIPHEVENAKNKIILTQASPGLFDIKSHSIVGFLEDIKAIIDALIKDIK